MGKKKVHPVRNYQLVVFTTLAFLVVVAFYASAKIKRHIVLWHKVESAWKKGTLTAVTENWSTFMTETDLAP